MPFTKLTLLTKLIADLPDIPSETMTSAELKQYWDQSPKEVKDALNKLIDELQATTAASNIGVSAITGITGTKLQDVLVSFKSYIDTSTSNVQLSINSHKNDKNNPHGVTAKQLNVYTKDELAPYLQGGDTLIKYEVFTIVSSNNGDGTFTYKDVNDVQHIGTLTAEGYQTFTLLNGHYDTGMNRIECTINDTLQRSTASGGLQEVDTTNVTLTMPEGAGAEVTFKYFERIGITGEHNIVYGSVQPPASSGNTMWFKVV